MELIRNKHFKAYLQSLYVKMMARHQSRSEADALAMFEDEFFNDVNMITFVLESTYSNTKRVGDIYHFTTKDDFIHTDIKTGKAFNPGAMTLYIDDDLVERVSFDNPKFHHGQIRDKKGGYEDNEVGRVSCWGGFKHHGIGQMFCSIGLSGMLMDMYNFARVSDHGTYMEGHDL